MKNVGAILITRTSKKLLKNCKWGENVFKKIKIGNVELENNIFLAPMAGITDLPFRTVCKQFGPGLTYTEMVSSKALYYNDEKTKNC